MMKVNFKYAIMAIAALTVGLTSCSNDDELTDGEVDNGAETYMKVAISFPQSTTPQVRSTGDVNATDAEAAVQTVDVFIYSGDAYLSRTRLTASDFTQGAATADGDFYEAQTKIRTTTGAKSILVGINLPLSAATGLEHKTLSYVKTNPQTLTRAEMTNTTNGIPMFSTAAATSTFVADETDPANTITATVQRMVAKVTVEQSPSMVQDGVAGELGSLEFAINNFNEKSFLIQNAAPDYKDPNWASGSYVASDFSDAGAQDWKTVVTTVSNIKTLDAHYAAENTSEDSRMKEITRATVRATFMPNVITVYDNGVNNSNGYKTADRVTDLSITTPQTFYTVTVSVTSGTAYFYDSAIADAYVADNGGTKVTYVNGVCYWNMYLNKDTGRKGKQWDVVRNEFFRCQITRIVAPGNATIEVTDPDETPDSETNIFTDIEILNWNTPILSDYELEP